MNVMDSIVLLRIDCQILYIKYQQIKGKYLDEKQD